jgi:antitoxin component of MazEF toxin-antitoxin module
MNITEGDKVFIDIINNTIVITPVPKNISELSGIAKGLYEEDYIEKERSKWD